MKLYNTQTQRTETFTPHGDTVSVYVCGITPYDTTHLGHAFTYASFDVLIRYLEQQGYKVNYVQNVTDIDDDILRKAKEMGEDWQALGNQWTAHFIEDMKGLNIRPPDKFPRATDVITEIITSVQRLLDIAVAYKVKGSVYFRVSRWPDYGKLSHIPHDDLLPTANERGNRPDDPNKHNPLDFVLWQAQAQGEPAWQSPWGMGRPGWHIECSTMISRYVGGTLDIHGGGSDLIFPHHESEVAQAEAGRGHKPFVRYWMHTAMVNHEGEKMSKSLGNLVMVSDLLKTWSPDALRLYMAKHHYRQVWSYNENELADAAQLAKLLNDAVQARGGEAGELDASEAQVAFKQAMDNDLDTPAAIEAMSKLTQDILDANHVSNDLAPAQQALREMAEVFGLVLDAEQPEASVVDGWDKHLIRFSQAESTR